MHKNKKRNLIIVIALMLGLCLSSFTAGYAVTATEKLEEAKAAAKKRVEATENLQEAVEALEELQAELEEIKKDIAETKEKMEKKQKQIDKQEGDLGQRLTAMYKTGTVGFVDVILSSDDISDLITNIGMVQTILRNDQNLLQSLEKDYEELDEMNTKLEEDQVRVEANKIETEALKEKYQAEADKAAEEEAQLLAEANALAAEAAANSSNAEEQIIASGGSIDTSSYSWPTTSRVITDDYGWRICPFHGKEFHNGLDIGVSTGSPIYAIADGVITRASWYGGYGNCVVITCGGGVSALYGHLSGYNCSSGQYVTKGQVIGYTGSTGNSTGPHLHFSTFLNGGDLNPWSLY